MKFAVFHEKLVPEQLLLTPATTQTITSIADIPQPPTNPSFSFNPELQKLLLGKQLLIDEIPYAFEEIQSHYENGYVTLHHGITRNKNSPKCERCGNQDPDLFATFPCLRCREACTYCRKCIMMGRVSTCAPLYGWIEVSDLPQVPASLDWTGTLSPGQQHASNQVVESIKANKELLVWAVCGAGKTEVLFEGIQYALSHQKRVCVATPRTDVVLELTPRLQAVFPTIEVTSLYGGSDDRQKYSPLTIITTHQLLRFYKAFDTIILDEVDAFPYSVDEALQYAVKQARKDTSSLIYLTATPNEQWQKECRLGKREFVTIPARYHRHPLPVPDFVWCGNWNKALTKGRLPANVMKWLKYRIEAGKQVLLFIPKIDLISKILPILHVLHPNIEAVHAEDPNRKEKVTAMRNKEIPLLITTTILERGVTFPNLDVAVLGSEDRIFTESALVQISGRVGRSAEFPSGDITFFHYGLTESMLKARKQIQAMNKEALQKGLIEVE
ncbi:DEAD/DEAH box helicase [Bacillaceae bacterium CLA-AA-H227]|uniref:DEAD/DEAH box helicase n=1 Tax=Robertmurraya yapensis (ex Hitch et al 2024) TaxID=3133160 RepID=A0ACC6SBW6_9BACI